LKVVAREFLSRFRFVQKLTEQMDHEMQGSDEKRAEEALEVKAD
jgi:hypothetical protein